MKRKQASQAKSPLIRLIGLEAVVAATGIAGSMAATAAPGDLDPAFGDVGRQSDLGILTTLWSTDVAPDGSVVASGGDDEYDGWYGYYYEDNFSSWLLPTGAVSADFLAVPLEKSIVYDSARQADGRLVEVGQVRLVDGSVRMQVSRRMPDGTLDPGFGLNGKAWIDDGTNVRTIGRSVIVDSDQRIVVAGFRSQSLMVARLLPDGTLDPGFATGGKFRPADSFGADLPPRIAAAPGGGYRLVSNTRVLAGSTSRACAVAAIDEAGLVDASYGQGGTAAAPSLPGNSEPTLCWSMVIAPDGGMLLGGRQGADAYLQRLQPDGSAAPGFSSGAVNARLSFVRAIAAPTSDKIYVTGDPRSSLFGAPVLRLDSNGMPDAGYGQDGIAQVAIQTARPGFHYLNDLQPGPGGTLVVGGNVGSNNGTAPFVARLLGDSGPGGPGLLSLQQDPVLATESGPPAVLKVGRIGGSTGAVAVSYRTRALSDRELANLARGGEDYTTVAGRLTWDSGDVSERTITVPITADTIGEQPEFLEVVLEAAEGGAGLAVSGAEVEIAGSGYPAGAISLTADPSIIEGSLGYLYLARSQYSVGVASVTVRVTGGTATPGDDFGSRSDYRWQDVVVTWDAGQSASKLVPIFVRRDNQDEASEAVQFELVAATGGAVLDPDKSQVVVTINNKPTSGSGSGSGGSGSGGGGGGGSFGWLATMMLGLAGLWRRLSRR